jgi:hypothetical protein
MVRFRGSLESIHAVVVSAAAGAAAAAGAGAGAGAGVEAGVDGVFAAAGCSFLPLFFECFALMRA